MRRWNSRKKEGKLCLYDEEAQSVADLKTAFRITVIKISSGAREHAHSNKVSAFIRFLLLPSTSLPPSLSLLSSFFAFIKELQQ